jgi:hypothetical protein
MQGSKTLREDFPALALTVGFAPPHDRELMADLLLLWMEINRARNAAENMIAAARISWWRDALDKNRPEGVPLAERLIKAIPEPTPVTDMFEKVIGITLDQGDDHLVCHAVGDMMAIILNKGEGGDDIAHTLLAFRRAMAGKSLDGDIAKVLIAAPLPVPIKLIAWLAQAPERLNYPEGQPLLPLKMMIRAFRL